MPSVIEAPEFLEHEHTTTPFLTTAPLQRQAARRGFWRTLAQWVRRPYVNDTSHLSPHHYTTWSSIETPDEALARHYPSLYIRVTCGV